MKLALIFSLAFLFFTSHYVFAQNKPCQLKINESPALRKVQLGMTTAQVSREFGKTIYPTLKGNLYLVSGNIEAINKILNNNPQDLVKKEYTLKKKLLDKDDAVSQKLRANLKDGRFFEIYLPEVKTFDSLSSGDFIGLKSFEDVTSAELEFFNNRVYKMNFAYKTSLYVKATTEERILSLEKLFKIKREYWHPHISDIIEANCKDFKVTASFFAELETIAIVVENVNIQPVIDEKVINEIERMYEALKRKMYKFKP
jgi:hypothetical protein